MVAVEIALDRGSLDGGDRASSTRQRVEAVADLLPRTAGAMPATSAPPPRPCVRRCRASMSRLSSDVLPQIKEYDRVCTTVVNAYVGPALERYLDCASRRASRSAGLPRSGA